MQNQTLDQFPVMAPRKVTLPLYLFFYLSQAFAIPFAWFNPDLFEFVLMREDGPYEYLTALFLVVAGVLLVWRASQLRGQGLRALAVLTVFYALLFFFVAGEEISWGQRIFGWVSGDFFVENNFQEETNLHNMMVGDTQLATSLFGSWLTVVLLLYLVVLPLLYPFANWVRRFCEILAVPVPRPRHAVLAIAASIALLMCGEANRRFELYEFAFGVMATLIFLEPRNLRLYGGRDEE
ncbi:hypothetical protein [Pseudooceanicola marinus]|uniref:hypothetical protein n=1 Tax=Pseudooceanicola marinus TaxID=396013 RepID=UPI001CD63511|nr:hypothetical protein [Pseudooceanicola marinus]MCA1337715.1 hypothetical protein [Pseudooceanicola marinus]